MPNQVIRPWFDVFKANSLDGVIKSTSPTGAIPSTVASTGFVDKTYETLEELVTDTGPYVHHLDGSDTMVLMPMPLWESGWTTVTDATAFARFSLWGVRPNCGLGNTQGPFQREKIVTLRFNNGTTLGVGPGIISTQSLATKFRPFFPTRSTYFAAIGTMAAFGTASTASIDFRHTLFASRSGLITTPASYSVYGTTTPEADPISPRQFTITGMSRYSHFIVNCSSTILGADPLAVEDSYSACLAMSMSTTG